MPDSNRRTGETVREYARRLGFGGDGGSDTDDQAGSQDQSVGEQVVQDEATEAFREAGATPDSKPRADDQTAAADPTDEAGGGGLREAARNIASGVGDAVGELTGGSDGDSQRVSTGRVDDRDAETNAARVDTGNPGAGAQTQAALRTLRNTGTTTSEARAGAAIRSLRRNGTPSGERRDLGRARDEPFGDPTVPVIDEVAGRDPGAAIARRGRQIGRRIGGGVGGALGGTVDSATAAARNPEDVVSVRSGPIQAGDEGFQISASVPQTDDGPTEEAGRGFGRRAGALGSIPGDLVGAVDEGAELGIATTQEAPELVEGGGLDIRSGPIRQGNRGFRVTTDLRPDVADESNAVTDALAVTGSRALRGGAEAAGLRVNPNRARQGNAGDISFVGERAERALADTEASVFAADRDETGALIERDPDVSPEEAFGRLTGGAATLGLSVAAGTAATRGLQAASRRGRGFARRRRADIEIDARDTVRDESILETGEQPTFDTDTDAPAERARREFERRASANPDELIDGVSADEGVLLRSESARLPANNPVGRGSFELPGLFTSADAPPLRADLGDSDGTSRTTLRLPRPSDFSPDRDRFSAFPGDDIETMPERAADSGRRRNPETGDLEPDPTTAGSQFLIEDAEPGTAYVRATGDRTPELEAVLPPDTELSRQGTGIIRLPDGETADIDLFRRPADRERRVSGGLGVVRGDSGDAGTVTVRELARPRRRRDRSEPRGEPIGVVPSSDGPVSLSDPTSRGSSTITGVSTRTPNTPTETGGGSGVEISDSGGVTPGRSETAPGDSVSVGGGGGVTFDGRSDDGGGVGGEFTFDGGSTDTTTTTTTFTPFIPTDTPRPRDDLDLFETEPEVEDRRPRLSRRDDIFSSGFVSGAELLDLAGIDDRSS